jgi:hypothetical protein
MTMEILNGLRNVAVEGDGEMPMEEVQA